MNTSSHLTPWIVLTTLLIGGCRGGDFAGYVEVDSFRGLAVGDRYQVVSGLYAYDQSRMQEGYSGLGHFNLDLNPCWEEYNHHAFVRRVDAGTEVEISHLWAADAERPLGKSNLLLFRGVNGTLAEISPFQVSTYAGSVDAPGYVVLGSRSAEVPDGRYLKRIEAPASLQRLE